MAALNHVVGLILGVQGGFETTFRIQGYSMGRPRSSTWSRTSAPWWRRLDIALIYYGFKNAHNLSSGRAVIAATWMILAGLCCGVFFALFFGAIASRAGASGGGF